VPKLNAQRRPHFGCRGPLNRFRLCLLHGGHLRQRESSCLPGILPT
jgi:hypothetical protein